MKLRTFFAAAALATVGVAGAWAPVGDRIKTRWAETVTPENVWQKYPRPNMQRQVWQNLNGIWNYAITAKDATAPGEYQGEILVPFPIESSLSGVGKNVNEKEALWYERTFTVPSDWKGSDVLLNFGAVDWQCEVWVNGVSVGTHTGGYTPFSLNITKALKKGENTLTVRVYDPTNKGFQPIGKQTQRPHGIWYTAVTGIWQTVWLEPVAAKHIASLRTLPDIDKNILSVTVDASAPGLTADVKVLDGDKLVAEGKGSVGEAMEIAMPADVKLWSPDSPAIYELEITLFDGKKAVDRIDSYAAMRKIGMKRGDDGHIRMQLNNEDLFQFGTLDQGWWPDGLYTAPSYEAMVYDIDKTKELGFNMIRKHVKVEPALWYEYCDRNGMLVWQDMPSGDNSKGYQWQNKNYFEGNEYERSAESEADYRAEWQDIMDSFYNYPSIVVWVPFNEGWGQFKTAEITDWTKVHDPSRLVNPASGGNFFHTGDILDLHNYPGPDMYLADPERVNVLGEYGGIGLALPGHLWAPDKNWGYIQFKNEKEVTDEYVKYAQQLLDMVKDGFSGSVYTQTTDVEIEVNGLMTYDREKVKVETDRVKEINKKIVDSLKK